MVYLVDPQKYSILKTIIAVPLAILIIFVALFAYSGVWSPIVVVDSGSMQHNDESSIGTIDAGDIVIIKSTDSFENVTTYVEGISSGHKTYDGYGDVIIFNSEQLNKSIIHRAIIELEYDDSTNTFSAQSLKNLDENLWEADGSHSHTGLKDEIILKNVEYLGGKEIVINLKTILFSMGNSPHGGIVTMGDNNTRIDQVSGISDLVEEKDIIGKSRGELPWFGIINLLVNGYDLDDVPQNSKNNLIISIILIIGMPLVISLFIDYKRKRLN